MQPRAYYNEHDRAKAQTLRNLIEEGAIAHGHVDERPIQEVQPSDLRGFTQHHFFAGGGVWSYALRLAGWPDDRPVWTGSCPCGPFSAAGKKRGFEDPRHLWPKWLPLIRECRPHRIFGEQSDDAHAWVDLVSTDLENLGYAVGTPDIPAAGFGGAHIRQRYYWVADANDAEWWSERAPWNDGHWPKTGRVKGDGHARNGGQDGWLADSATDGCGELQHAPAVVRAPGPQPEHEQLEIADGLVRFRADGVDWLLCRDGLLRPVEPGSCPLVDAAPARVGRLRLYGDAIDAETAANFVGAYLDAAPVVP